MNLTPQEALQAVIDGKKVEYALTHPDYKIRVWEIFTGREYLDILTCGEFEFRLAQEMITIDDVSFPKPESEPLKKGTEYWVADPTFCHYALAGHWVGDKLDKLALSRGLLHKSKEDAIAHAKALIRLSGGNVDE